MISFRGFIFCLFKLIVRYCIVSIWAFFISVATTATPLHAQVIQAEPLSVDDLRRTEQLDEIRSSPDGRYVAYAVLRPPLIGEVFGRTSIFSDTSRSDLFVFDRRRRTTIGLFDGHAAAAGAWCPTWSPDGRNLAFLSTRPADGEAVGRGGVRLYVWNAQANSTRLLDERQVQTQTRLGSPLGGADFRGGFMAPGHPNRCQDGDEAASFRWASPSTIVAMVLEDGLSSNLLSQFEGVVRQDREALDQVREGATATGMVFDPQVNRTGTAGQASQAGRHIIAVYDIARGDSRDLISFSPHPSRREVSLVIDPQGQSAALLFGSQPTAAPVNMTYPTDDSWFVSTEFFLLDLTGRNSAIRVSAPDGYGDIVQILGWKRDGSALGLRVRDKSPSFQSNFAELDISAGSVNWTVHPLTMQPGSLRMLFSSRTNALALPGGGWVVKGIPPGGDSPQWLFVPIGGPYTKYNQVDAQDIAQSQRGIIYYTKKDEIYQLSSSGKNISIEKILTVRGSALQLLQFECIIDGLVVLSDQTRRSGLRRRSAHWLSSGPQNAAAPFRLGTDTLLHYCGDQDHYALISRPDINGQKYLSISRAGKIFFHSQRGVYGVKENKWGSTEIIDYKVGNVEFHAGVIRPSDFDPSLTYPVIVWVYPGLNDVSVINYVMSRKMPEFYNLHLYASRGYIVLVPGFSPLSGGTPSTTPNPFRRELDAALQALGVSTSRELGPVGLIGQSAGGYLTLMLSLENDSIAGAVAMASIVDLASYSGSFDAIGRQFGSSSSTVSENWILAERGQLSIGAPFFEQPQLYRSLSPIDNVNRIRVPLLILHGQYDRRGSADDAQQFYSALARERPNVRLVVYGGESHTLMNSPANSRDVLDRTLEWFERHLRN